MKLSSSARRASHANEFRKVLCIGRIRPIAAARIIRQLTLKSDEPQYGAGDCGVESAAALIAGGIVMTACTGYATLAATISFLALVGSSVPAWARGAAGASKPAPASSSGNQFVEFEGHFVAHATKKEKVRDRLAAARYTQVKYSRASDDSNSAESLAIAAANRGGDSRFLKPFEAAADLQITRLTIHTSGMPASAFPHLAGDHCLFIKDAGTGDAGAAAMCTATAVWGDEGYTRTLAFPGGQGLYVPKGAHLGCAVHMIAPAYLDTPMTEELAGKAKVSCRIEYETVAAEQPVYKFLRIPYLDQMRQAPDLIAPDRPWYGPWDTREPLVIKGFTAYYGPKGKAADRFGPKSICVYAVRADGSAVPGKELCLPPQSYRPGTTNVSFEPAFVAGAFAIEPGEYLSGRCRLQQGRASADCALYPFVEIPAARRSSIGAGPLHSGRSNVNLDYLRNSYCRGDADVDNELTFAGKRVLGRAAGQGDGEMFGEGDGRGVSCENIFDRPRE